MNADEYLLKLPNIALNSREILPEKPGIYYVIDEKYVIWYIGQAKNLRNRWVGDSHHRIHQLKKQKKRQFTVYYELVNESMLDLVEKRRIEQYNPQLNGTKVNSKKTHPTETLLRKTLMTIAPYSFILGVEPPRNEDINLNEYSKIYGDNWRVNKSVIPLQVIHICINLTEIEELTQNWSSAVRFLKNVFRKCINSSDNWSNQGGKRYYRLRKFVLRRLLVNGIAIEVYGVDPEVVSSIHDYTTARLAGVEIKTVTDVSLEQIRNKCLLNHIAGLYLKDDKYTSSYADICSSYIKRLTPYKEDLVKIFFNESIDISKLLTPTSGVKTNETSDTGLSVRLDNLTLKKEYLKKLLIERGIDLNKYEVKNYLENLPKDNNYCESNRLKKMIVYVKNFIYTDLREPGYSSSMINGQKGIIYQTRNVSNNIYEEVYMAVTVDRAFWLLFESYLSDFVKVTLNENEGYIDKYYISPRKTLKPAIISVTINGKWKADLPISPKNNMSYLEVVEVIKTRLENSGIPNLKFAFKLM
ncbi:GIY-YIG nuclease family protein [Nostoc parmelioides]|uniref:Excinuclease ABC subunit C n=1 Tax=Nostoc parmelioides FACHB-3921 TaxID=2692909 RepID=A0ABR8BEF9_9NOSO|nr:excinuclease ABC subunit C [Nostoc parmelioides]MBD2252467.1 excinuclease ABC subunit C [Nostoc parmelioides FACHB-3921]